MGSLRWTDERMAAYQKRLRDAQTPRAVHIPPPKVTVRVTEAGAKIKRSKYRNEPCTVNGERFDSKGEASRYAVLLAMKEAGAITGLRRQVEFGLTVEGQLIGKYIADFAYVQTVAGRRTKYVVEDWKSPASKTPLYEWKKKHLLAEHGIEIFETGRAT